MVTISMKTKDTIIQSIHFTLFKFHRQDLCEFSLYEIALVFPLQNKHV